MRIRKYAPKDTPEVRKLLDEFLAYTRKSYTKDTLRFDDYKYPKKSFSAAKLTDFIKYPHSNFLVSEEDGRVTGYIVGVAEKKENRPKKKAGNIKSFFVTKNARGKGTGKALYRALAAWFRRKGCDHLELDVMDGNPTIGMYERWGFRIVRINMKRELR